MVKTRMNQLDLRVQARELNRRLSSARVANVYDIDDRTYTLKLSVPPRRHDSTQAETNDKAASSTSSWSKITLLIESGSRIHTTFFDREKSNIPSGFALKLRKHLRTKRLNSIAQLGSDRVIDMDLTSAEEHVHIIAEFYSAGNIILTDENYVIMALLRTFHPRGEKTTAKALAVGATYQVDQPRAPQRVDEDLLRDALQSLDGNLQARKALPSKLQNGPQFVEHALATAKLASDSKVKDLLANEDAMKGMVTGFAELEALLAGQDVESMELRGYITYDNDDLYDDYMPYLLAQYRACKTKVLDTFDEGVDEYFSKIEAQRSQHKVQKQETAAMNKVEKLRRHFNERVDELEREEQATLAKARLIEDNIEEVNAVLTVFRSAVAAGIDWHTLDKMLTDEQESGNPVLNSVHSLHLEKNEITMMLAPKDYEEEEMLEQNDAIRTQPAALVDIRLDLNARKNVDLYFKRKKVSGFKADKTSAAAERTVLQAEAKARKEVKRIQTVQPIRAKRKQFWFEKFYWFISSENYLVIAGRDAQQNDLIVKRYMGPNDAYVHANVRGAASVVVKNRSNDVDIPPLTLSQAGCFAMCRSAAWTGRIVTSSWWVRPSQVSKTAQSGEYVSTGSFVIRGKKNFLPPEPLVFGFAMLFKIDESCIPRHLGERAVRSFVDTEQSAAANADKSPEGEAVGDEELTLEDEEEGSKAVARMAEGADFSHDRSGSERVDHRDEEAHNSDDIGGSRSTSDGDDSAKIAEKLAETNLQTDNAGESSVSEGEELPAEANRRSATDTHMGTTPVDGEASTAEADQSDTSSKRPPKHDTQRADISAQSKGGHGFDALHDSEPPAEGMNEVADESARAGTAGKGALKSRKAERVKTVSSDGKAATTPGKGNVAAADGLGQSNKPLPRGKRTKMKRVRRKYMEQDDEERELAMAALGSVPLKEFQSANEQTGKQEKEKEDQDDALLRAQARKERAERIREREEVEHVRREEGLIDLSAVDEEFISALDSLTGAPTEDDLILYALPVCAPYSALNSYKYRAKLLPGTLKRSKAYNQCLELYKRTAGKQAFGLREVELMKLVPDSDSLPTMLPDVRVAAPGLQNAQRTSKKQRARKS